MPQVTSGDVTISYSDSGTGVPVLLIHAFPLNSKMWEPQIEALSDRFRFIAPDLRGFGGSEAPEDRTGYTVDAFADDLKAVLDDAGVTEAVVCGLSLGGYVAFAFLRRHLSYVKALVLADTRPEADAPENITKRSGQQDTVASEGTAGLIDALPGALLGEPTREKKPDVVAHAKELMNNPAAGFIGALEAMKQRPDSTATLAAISVPTLIIVGENDGLTPPELSRNMHEHIRDSRLVVIPEAGHLSSLEAPESFNGALAEFLGTVS